MKRLNGKISLGPKWCRKEQKIKYKRKNCKTRKAPCFFIGFNWHSTILKYQTNTTAVIGLFWRQKPKDPKHFFKKMRRLNGKISLGPRWCERNKKYKKCKTRKAPCFFIGFNWPPTKKLNKQEKQWNFKNVYHQLCWNLRTWLAWTSTIFIV